MLHIVLGAGVIAALAGAVMLLWNWLVPGLFGGGTVGYCQALGLFLLGRLLFGGLKFGNCRCHCGCHGHGGRHFHEKWDKMTPEQRKEFMHTCQCGCQAEDASEE